MTERIRQTQEVAVKNTLKDLKMGPWDLVGEVAKHPGSLLTVLSTLASACGISKPTPIIPVSGGKEATPHVFFDPTLTPTFEENFTATLEPTLAPTATAEVTPSLYPKEVTDLAESLGLEVTPRDDAYGGWYLTDKDGNQTGIWVRKNNDVWIKETDNNYVEIKYDQLSRSNEGVLQVMNDEDQIQLFKLPDEGEFAYNFSISRIMTQEEFTSLIAEGNKLHSQSEYTSYGNYVSWQYVFIVGYRLKIRPDGSIDHNFLLTNQKGELLHLKPRGLQKNLIGELVLFEPDPDYDEGLYPFSSSKTEYVLSELDKIFSQHKIVALVTYDDPINHPYASPEAMGEVVKKSFSHVDFPDLGTAWWDDFETTEFKDLTLMLDK